MRIDFNEEPKGITITWGKVILWVFSLGMFVVIFTVVYGSCHTAAKMIDNTQKVVFQQFSPEALLKKYEWFKDASAALDAKVATLQAYDAREATYEKKYGADALKWPRNVQEQSDIWQSEQLGVKASYNTLAAEYNAAMAKFNYRFCNVGGLPQGATTVLPREYKPYLTE